MPMQTPQSRTLIAMLEPVWAVATKVYNASTVGRNSLMARREGLVKQGLPQTRPGLHETIQSALGKPRVTTETVQAQLYNTADFAGIPGV
jgi:hypothetical protein